MIDECGGEYSLFHRLCQQAILREKHFLVWERKFEFGQYEEEGWVTVKPKHRFQMLIYGQPIRVGITTQNGICINHFYFLQPVLLLSLALKSHWYEYDYYFHCVDLLISLFFFDGKIIAHPNIVFSAVFYLQILSILSANENQRYTNQRRRLCLYDKQLLCYMQ